MAKRKTVAENYGVKSLEIEQFRKFKPMTIPIGQKITVISGQNGTGKSTLLGMLGQPFGLEGQRSVFGKQMRAKFTDMFKLSPDKDIPGEHLYYVNLRDGALYDGRTRVQVKSYARSDYAKMPIRLVTGETRKKGDGNIDYPVIYLGLKRTYPVGEIPNVTSAASGLTEEEAAEFVDWYAKVFCSWRQGAIEPVELGSNSVKKNTLLVNAEEYDFLANSAGQDNLGQILAALISFKRVKTGMGEAYRGGILLIDELDATLFPASQEALFDLFMDLAESLMIQIVFTTHSFSLLEKALGARREDVEVVYLRRRSSGIELLDNPTMDDVRADLNVRPASKSPRTKVEVWCEDEEAAWFLRSILPRRVLEKCQVVPAKLGCGELAELSTRELASIKNVLFVVDGDSLEGSSKKIRESDRLVVLPTKGKSPERALYDELVELPDDGLFWVGMERDLGLTQQMFVRSFEESHSPRSAAKPRRLDKDWLKKEKASGRWGANGVNVIRGWREENQSQVDAFAKDMDSRVDKLIRRVEAMAKRKPTV